MYAFCVLELETNSKVSIKKQQQAIQKVLDEQQRSSIGNTTTTNNNHSSNNNSTRYINSNNGEQVVVVDGHLNNHDHQQHHQQSGMVIMAPPQTTSNSNNQLSYQHANSNNHHHNHNHHQQQSQQFQQLDTQIPLYSNGESSSNQQNLNGTSDGGNVNGALVNNNASESPAKMTLAQLEQEVAPTRKCYTDFQKSQVLTSAMLRDVQKRFAKYYPCSAIPSRTTIKHVFEKCVAHGTVENIKTPRKVTKIPQGDEIEYLLIHEPQLSLRQMAQKLNVSTGTVSRRCKALGLIPESVTIKHQQLATAKRQKQIKQLEGKNGGNNHATSPTRGLRASTNSS